MRRGHEVRRLASGIAPGALGVAATTLVVGVIALVLVAAAVGALGIGGGTSQEEAPAAERCVRWYPDYCVPADRGALDCADLPRAPLAVEGGDPFDFDRDLDGTGCEEG